MSSHDRRPGCGRRCARPRAAWSTEHSNSWGPNHRRYCVLVASASVRCATWPGRSVRKSTTPQRCWRSRTPLGSSRQWRSGPASSGCPPAPTTTGWSSIWRIGGLSSSLPFCGLRAIGLIGRRDSGAGTAAARERLINALAPDLRAVAGAGDPRTRVAGTGRSWSGTAPAPETVVTWVAWHRPRRGGQFRDDLVEWSVSSGSARADRAGCVASHAEPLLGAEPTADELAEALSPLMPEPVSEVLLQADLTAVAPGPLVRVVQDELSAMETSSRTAAPASTGSVGSVRRAFDLGRLRTSFHTWLVEHSRTPVPQPLTYLIDDVARRHGVLRLGTASTYLRCDDETVLTQLLNATCLVSASVDWHRPWW